MSLHSNWEIKPSVTFHGVGGSFEMTCVDLKAEGLCTWTFTTTNPATTIHRMIFQRATGQLFLDLNPETARPFTRFLVASGITFNTLVSGRLILSGKSFKNVWLLITKHNTAINPDMFRTTNWSEVPGNRFWEFTNSTRTITIRHNEHQMSMTVKQSGQILEIPPASFLPEWEKIKGQLPPAIVAEIERAIPSRPAELAPSPPTTS